jgi:hypothetical protein
MCRRCAKENGQKNSGQKDCLNISVPNISVLPFVCGRRLIPVLAFAIRLA